MTRQTRRAALCVAVVLSVASGTAGCGGSSPVTATRLQASIAPTFANLYVRQQAERGQPGVVAASVAAQATCVRSAPGHTDSGAGDDWVCALQWLVAGPGTPVGARYDVSVTADGCYTADGPAAVVGQQALVTATGTTVVNPLWQFQSCFDTT